jgi:hypothetical protein
MSKVAMEAEAIRAANPGGQTWSSREIAEADWRERVDEEQHKKLEVEEQPCYFGLLCYDEPDPGSALTLGLMLVDPALAPKTELGFLAQIFEMLLP